MADIVDTILWTVLALMGAVILFMLYRVFFTIRKHKETIHFKEPIKGSFQYTRVKARAVKDRDGNEWWKTLKKINGKKFFPVPPGVAVHLDSKGKKHANAYINQHGEIIYIEDPNTDLFNNPKILKAIQPITTNERAVWLNQMRKSHEDVGFNWKENLPFIIGGMFLVILLIISSFVVTDLYENSGRIQDQNLKIAEKQAEIASIYRDIDNNLQSINEQRLNNTGGPPN